MNLKKGISEIPKKQARFSLSELEEDIFSVSKENKKRLFYQSVSQPILYHLLGYYKTAVDRGKELLELERVGESDKNIIEIQNRLLEAKNIFYNSPEESKRILRGALKEADLKNLSFGDKNSFLRQIYIKTFFEPEDSLNREINKYFIDITKKYNMLVSLYLELYPDLFTSKPYSLLKEELKNLLHLSEEDKFLIPAIFFGSTQIILFRGYKKYGPNEMEKELSRDEEYENLFKDEKVSIRLKEYIEDYGIKYDDVNNKYDDVNKWDNSILKNHLENSLKDFFIIKLKEMLNAQDRPEIMHKVISSLFLRERIIGDLYEVELATSNLSFSQNLMWQQQLTISRMFYTVVIYLKKFSEDPPSGMSPHELIGEDTSHYIFLGYLRRGQIYYLQGRIKESVNDYLRCFEIIKFKSKSQEVGRNEFKILNTFLMLFIGKSYYAEYNFNSAFDGFCGAMRSFFSDLLFFSKSPQTYFRMFPSISVIEGELYKGKIFFERGNFRAGLKWCLSSLRDLMIIEEIERDPKETGFKYYPFIESKEQESYEKIVEECFNKSELPNIKDGLKHLQKLIKYLDKCKRIEERELIDKASLLEELKFHIDGILGYTSEKYWKLQLNILTRIGYILYQLDLYHLDNGKLPIEEHIDFKTLCKAGGWNLNSKRFSDKNDPLAINDILLCLIREYTREEKEEKRKELKALFDKICEGAGKFYERFYNNIERTFSAFSLLNIAKNIFSGMPIMGSDFYNRLFTHLIQDVGNIISRPKEYYQYLIRDGRLEKENQGDFDQDPQIIDRLVVLRQWNSFSPRVPRPRKWKIRGGGYFLIWQGKGIVIDPGFNFIENFYENGFSLEDIDAIVITHAHIDHMDDLDALLALIYERNQYFEDTNMKEKKKTIDVFFNIGSMRKSSPWVSVHRDVLNIHTLNPGTTLSFKEKYSFEIEIIKAKHWEIISEEFAVGLIFGLFQNKTDNDPVFRIGFTSDSGYYKEDDEFSKDTKPGEKTLKDFSSYFRSCNIIVAHIGNLTFKELAVNCGIYYDINDIIDVFKGISEKERENFVKKLGFGDECNKEDKFIKLDLMHLDKVEVKSQLMTFLKNQSESNKVFNEEEIKNWQKFINKEKSDILDMNIFSKKEGKWREFINNLFLGSLPEYYLKNHLGVRGLYEIFETCTANDAWNINKKIMVISEFDESLGSFRDKLAYRFNRLWEEKKRRNSWSDKDFRCFTGDIGIQIILDKDEPKLLCNKCSEDNDLRLKQAFYSPFGDEQSIKIKEVCIKEADERIKYLCKRHFDWEKGQGIFLEKYEPILTR